KSGVCAGSVQPAGLSITAMETSSSPLASRPMNSLTDFPGTGTSTASVMTGAFSVVMTLSVASRSTMAQEDEDPKPRSFGKPIPGQRGYGGKPAPVEPEPEPEYLPDDATVDVEAEKKETHAEEVLAELDDELVGLKPVKTRVREVADLLVVDRLRRRFGI